MNPRRPNPLRLALCSLVMLLLAAACSTPGQPAAAVVAITIQADGKQQAIQAPAGESVQQALERAKIQLGPLDRVDPPAYKLLDAGSAIRVVRVREEFSNEEKVIPFEHQTVKNESLPVDQALRIQPGENGRQQITYRKVYEDGVLISTTVFKTVTLNEARPEITMVGVQSPFAPTPLAGQIAYLTAGNAWIIREDTGNRRPLVTSGDLDGRIFALSPDGAWLLYTRKAPAEEKDTINSLWAVNTNEENARPVDLRVKNVVHSASWAPGAILTITYSTVEPRTAPPGWQANNDLYLKSFTASGAMLRDEQIIEANSGGIYGWWGTAFTWSPDGSQIAYARPDGVGLVNRAQKTLEPLLQITPLQTRSDWAWVPALAWSADNKLLYTVNHVTGASAGTPEESPFFDLTAIPLQGGPAVAVMARTGMFAYPAPEPLDEVVDGFQVAYLQAAYPEQSQNSAYQLAVMDRDGSNHRLVFPVDAFTGLQPHQVCWGLQNEVKQERQIGVIYEGNLWLVRVSDGQAQQITGDGSISRIDWK